MQYGQLPPLAAKPPGTAQWQPTKMAYWYDAIIDDIIPGLDDLSDHRIEPDRRRAIETALKYADSTDVVLIAGKGHEKYQEIEGVRLPFSDRQCVVDSLNGSIQ